MKLLTRRGFLASSALAAGALAALSAACAAPTPTPPPAKPAAPAAPPAAATKPAAPTAAPAAAAKPAAGAPAATLRFLSHVVPTGQTPRDRGMKAVSERVTEKHPEVKFQYEQIPWQQLGTKFMATYEAGNPPDIVLVSPETMRLTIRQGMLTELSAYLAKWSQADIDDLVTKAIWDEYMVDGKKYEMAIWPGLTFTVYRKDLYEKAGFDATKILTWDQFIEAGQKITTDKTGKHPTDQGFDEKNVAVWGHGREGATQGNPPQVWQEMLAGLGDSLLDPKTERANWTAPNHVRTFTMLRDFITKYRIQSREDLNRNLDEAQNAFAAGLYASFDDGSLRFEAGREKFQFPKENAVASLRPGFDGKKFAPSRVGDNWRLTIVTKSKAKDQAWYLYEEWFSKGGDLIWMEHGGQAPMRKSNFGAPILDQPEKAYLKTVLKQVESAGNFRYQNFEGQADILVPAFQEVVNGAPVEATLKKAQDAYHKVLEEAAKK